MSRALRARGGGEHVGETEVVAPRLTEFVRFAGSADDGRFVQHVTLRGLTFHHADWELDPRGNSSTQAAVEVPAVITADAVRALKLRRGDDALAIIKSTEVMIARAGHAKSQRKRTRA